MYLYLPVSDHSGQPLLVQGAAPSHRGLCLWTTLQAARLVGDGPVLVIDTERLTESVMFDGRGRAWVPSISEQACCNLSPYHPPRAVEAGGGYVIRRGAAGLEVLLIHRHGVWDLPKGKRDAGETVEACAAREVQEEVGIDTLTVVASLGSTQHTYLHKGRLCVKTTHWYLMQTPSTTFIPQADEGIEAVAWMPWHEAAAHLGYETLRTHLRASEDAVRQWVDSHL
ncbi:MAG: NUDIX hydrolase [Bacteroidota bacterium]